MVDEQSVPRQAVELAAEGPTARPYDPRKFVEGHKADRRGRMAGRALPNRLEREEEQGRTPSHSRHERKERGEVGGHDGETVGHGGAGTKEVDAGGRNEGIEHTGVG